MARSRDVVAIGDAVAAELRRQRTIRLTALRGKAVSLLGDPAVWHVIIDAFAFAGRR